MWETIADLTGAALIGFLLGAYFMTWLGISGRPARKNLSKERDSK